MTALGYINDFAERIASVRGPFQWNLLWTEIEESSLAPDEKGELRELILARLEGERALQLELHQMPPSDGRPEFFTNGGGWSPSAGAGSNPIPALSAAVGCFALTLPGLLEQIERAERVTDISWLMNEVPFVECSGAERLVVMERLMTKREALTR